MDNLTIPRRILTTAEFIALKPRTQLFLFALYGRFEDTERFTVDPNFPCDYGMSWGVHVKKRVDELIECGLLIEDGLVRIGTTFQRVLRFKYPLFETNERKAA
jgi:hypothetical protein